MIPWDQVPAGHRGRDYEWTGDLVRCVCRCRWRSTLARSLRDALALWVAHIRSLVRGPRS